MNPALSCGQNVDNQTFDDLVYCKLSVVGNLPLLLAPGMSRMSRMSCMKESSLFETDVRVFLSYLERSCHFT